MRYIEFGVCMKTFYLRVTFCNAFGLLFFVSKNIFYFLLILYRIFLQLFRKLLIKKIALAINIYNWGVAPGFRTNGHQKNGLWTNVLQTNGYQDKWTPGQMGPRRNGRRTIGPIKLASSKFGQKIFTFCDFRRDFSDLNFVIDNFN